jgi:hypothetical protein
VVGLGACILGDEDEGAGFDATAPRFGGAAAVAEALSDAGLGCDDYEPQVQEEPAGGSSSTAGARPAERGSCTIGGNVFTTIAWFESPDDQRAYRKWGETEGCAMLAPGAEMHYVAGNRWTIEPGGDLALIERITTEVGGALTTIRC